MRQRHKREDYDFRQLKDRSLKSPPAKRARGGRSQMPARGNAELHEPNTAKDVRTHSKSRAHSTKRKAVEMSGQPPRHRGDRPNRKGLTTGGASGAASMPKPPRLGLGGLGNLGNLGGLGGLGYVSQPNLVNTGMGLHDSRTPMGIGSKKGGRVSRPKRFDDGGAAGSTRPSDPGNEIASANKGRKSTADWIRDEVLGGTKPAYARGGRQRPKLEQ
jgi:hypothetical protein